MRDEGRKGDAGMADGAMFTDRCRTAESGMATPFRNVCFFTLRR